MLIAVVVGGGGLLLAQKALHKTSDTAFCLSCHSMSKPFEEYQGTVHFSNQKGIRAECADCHIPKSGMDYLFAKLKASKDIYHEFVSGKIDSDDKFETHRQEMAETVWKELKATDSATCRSCHSFDAMDIASQSESAQKMHNKAQKGGETLMNPLMILVKIIKLRWIHILSYDQMVSRKINNQTTRCANSIFYTTLFTNSAPNYT